MNRCDGKIALVTGGPRGLGAETAKRLAEAGASILLTDILDDEGRQTADAIADKGGKAHYMHHDVTSEEEWDAVVAEAKSRFGGLDILVNNAGIYYSKPIGETSMDDWRRMMSINVDGVFLGCRAALPLLRERAGKWRGGGSIVNLSSVSAQRGGGIFGGPHYSAAKGGILGLSKAMARELAPDQVRVNAICPGFIATDITAGKLTPEMKVQILEGIPMGRAGEASDVAGCALFLASDLSAYCTGTEVDVNGGSLIH